MTLDIELHTVADKSYVAAHDGALACGFVNATFDWCDVNGNLDIDIVSIAAPNTSHKEISLAAVAAGKHVYCEKPLAADAGRAREMAGPAEEAGFRTQVDFSYRCNPMFTSAQEIVVAGEFGEIRCHRGLHG